MPNFLHNFTPQPVALALGAVTVRWYGLFIVAGVILALMAAKQLAKNKQISFDDIIDLTFWLVLFGVIGARLYEVLILEPRYFFSNPAEVIKIWHGGLAIHGAIIAGLITLIVWCRQKKQDFWLVADLTATVLPLAQTLGRFGNYFNQEVFGWPTSLPWGIPIELANRPPEFVTEQYFHPAFLYESVLNLSLFIILFVLFKKQWLKSGQYLALYLLGYGLIRFLMEFVRLDQTAVIGGFRWPQIFSLLLIGVGLMIFYQKRKTPA